MFRGCDQFNRDLGGTLYPHRAGGGTRFGERGQCHKFIMAVVIESIFNLFGSANGKDAENIPFSEKCMMLSSTLYLHAIKHE